MKWLRLIKYGEKVTTTKNEKEKRVTISDTFISVQSQRVEQQKKKEREITTVV